MFNFWDFPFTKHKGFCFTCMFYRPPRGSVLSFPFLQWVSAFEITLSVRHEIFLCDFTYLFQKQWKCQINSYKTGWFWGCFHNLGVWFGVPRKNLVQRVDFELDMSPKRSCIFMYAVYVCLCTELSEWGTDFCCECSQSPWMESNFQIPSLVFWWEVSSGVLGCHGV